MPTASSSTCSASSADSATALVNALHSTWPTVEVVEAAEIDWPAVPTDEAIHTYRVRLHPRGRAAESLSTTATPVGGIAQVASQLNGANLRVDVDLTPLTLLERLRRPRAIYEDALAEDTMTEGGFHKFGREFLAGFKGAGGQTAPAPVAPDNIALGRQMTRHELALGRKAAAKTETHFHMTVRVTVEATEKARAAAACRNVLAALAQTTATARLHDSVRRVHIARMPIPLWTENNLLRRHMTHRREAGLAPVERTAKPVAASEVAWALGPVPNPGTVPGVRHSHGHIGEPPDLPDYAKSLFPLGRVRTRHGVNLAGIEPRNCTFGLVLAPSGYGKTDFMLSTVLAQWAQLQGVMVVDPEGTAIDRLLPHLYTAPTEVLIIDTRRRDKTTSWNVIDMRGVKWEDTHSKANAVISALAVANGWGRHNQRALTLTTMTVQTLVELAYAACQNGTPELQPTLLQGIPLLTNDAWRDRILKALSADLADFWRERFPLLGRDATGPVTQVWERLAADPVLKALIGQPLSTFNLAEAVNGGKMVLVCFGDLGDVNGPTMTNLLMHNLFAAAYGRPENSKPYWVHVDEVQTVDDGSGILAEAIARVRKRGIRLTAYTQNPKSLTPETFRALATNSSNFASSRATREGAEMIAPELGVPASAIQGLGKYEFIEVVTRWDKKTTPYVVHRAPLEELWPDSDPTSVTETMLDVDDTMGCAAVRSILNDVAGHHLRVASAAAQPPRRNGAKNAPKVPVPVGPRPLRPVGRVEDES